MKTLKLSNGEIRKGYELNDLSEDVKENVIIEQANFLVEIADSEEETDFDRAYVIDSIESNSYLFDEDGNMLPVTYHIRNSKLESATFGKKNYSVEFI